MANSRLGQITQSQTDDVTLTNKQFGRNIAVSITSDVIKPMEQLIAQYTVGLKSNSEPICVELYVLQHIQAIIDKATKLATKRAIDAGVLFDHKKSPQAASTTAILFDGERMHVECATRPSGTLLDTTKAKVELVKSGVPYDTVNKAFDDATKEKATSHSFKITIKDYDQTNGDE